MASRQTAASKLFATRGRKIGAAIAAAFLASIGAGIGAWTMTKAESVTKSALAGSSAPLQIHVKPPGTFFAGNAIGQYYVVPKRDIASPNNLDPQEVAGDDPIDFAFAQRHGGIEGSPQVVRLQLRGKSDDPVTINAIKIHVVKRASPVQGWYAVAPGCGGLEVKTGEIDLDAPQPAVHFVDLGPPNKNTTLFVTRTDIEEIELQAETSKAMVDWIAEFFYSGPDGDGSVLLDDHGRPFRVTSEAASDGYTLNFAGGPRFKREHRWDGTGISVC
jgi:hypothetical protein